MAHLTDLQLRIFEKPVISCEDFDEVLDDYCEGTIPQALQERLDAHLHSCECCEENYAAYQEVIDLGREIGEQTPRMTDDVRRNLREALNQRLGLSLPLR